VRRLVTASEIMGLPVVTVLGGEDLAEVRDVIYSPAEGGLAGLTLNKRGFFSGRLPGVLLAADIHAIGRHAVMVRDEASLSSSADAPDIGRPGTNRNVIGDDVLTEGGVSLGTVRDLVLLVGSTGEVVGYQIDTAEGKKGFIPLPAQLAVSGAALVVPEVTSDFVTHDVAELGASVDDFRARLERS
jgi:uncharacterized protein YrrD